MLQRMQVKLPAQDWSRNFKEIRHSGAKLLDRYSVGMPYGEYARLVKNSLEKRESANFL